jgi:signal transduction histidine kinase
VERAEASHAVGEGLPQGRIFLLLRYTLIIATAYLVLVEGDFAVPPVSATLLIAAALASNVALTVLGPRLAQSTAINACIILGDTAWVTTVLLRSGHFSADFFYLYFFVLLLAAIGENLALIAVGAVVVCAAYVYVLSMTGRNWSFWSSPSLIRIPFLFTTAAFYGYLVDQTRRQRHKADEADRIKSEFLGTISHELRTPLNVILGYVDLLLDRAFGQLLADQEEILRLVRNAGNTLHGFIGHLLDVSRIVNRLESGQERVVCSDVNLHGLFEDLRAQFPESLTIPVTWPQADDLPVVHTDREKLLTILRNLVENAVKYTSRGCVRVEAQWRREADAIDIRVIDTGSGIAARELPYIFEAFRRARPSPNQPAASGVGLGLYIVRQFVELLDGRISVTSKLGVGSTFSVRLPRRYHEKCEVVQREPVRVNPPRNAVEEETRTEAAASA